MIDELRTADDGTQFFRCTHFFREDSHFIDFGKALSQIVATEDEDSQSLFEKIMPELIIWLWSDYAKSTNRNFYCYHPNGRYDEEFNLNGFEFGDSFNDAAQEYLRAYVGIPMWAEMSIEYVDSGNEIYEIKNRDGWGNERFLNREGSSLGLIYASSTAEDDDLSYNPKLYPLDKFIIQDDPDWYKDQQTYYNWLDFDVSVDLKELEREEILVGITYSSLSEKERTHLVLAALETLKNNDLESKKVPQYLLSLLLNHPKTSMELRARIALVGDEDIIELGE
jgi:hypothetical protein